MPHIPRPFARPAVSLGARDVRRNWRTIPAWTLHVGDTVAEHGLVALVTRQDRAVEVQFMSGKRETFGPRDHVFAFTEAE
jgi:hypothetical protein